MTAEAAMRPGRPPFAPYHPWDHNFFLLMVVLIWVGVGNGFGFEILRHIQKHEAAYPLIVHVHAIAFVGWLVVLTIQVLLVRAGRTDLHMKLGLAAMGLAAAMVVIGPATAIAVGHMQLGTKDANPTFIAVQLNDIFAFAMLVGAAFAWRRTPPVHKRLILIATLFISDAGFARWLGDGLHAAIGEGYWGQFVPLYLCNDLLLLGIGAYDLATRRQLHPAWVAGTAFTLLLQLAAAYVYVEVPGWKAVSLHLLGG
jgi:hypothetical protein